MDPKTTTLGEAKDWLRARVRDGARCPCCDQYAKVYRRKLNASMARALIALARESGGAEVHLFRFLRERRIQHSDAPALRHWGFIKEADREREDGNPRAGYYRITQAGLDFAERRTSAASHALLYDNRLLQLDTEAMTTIVGALGRRFDYDELMAS